MEMSIITPREGLPLPGKCKICGGVDHEFYLDTGYQEEWYGAVIYCNECAFHMAGMVGCLDPIQAEKLKLEASTHYVEKMALLDRLKEVEGALNALGNAGFSVSDLPVSELNLDVLRQEPVIRPQRTENSVGEGTGTTDESSDDKDLDGLRSNEFSGEPADGFKLFG